MTDYLGTNFDAAEKKLKQALALCKGDACSNSVKAQLHRDLGVVYVAGQNKKDAGIAEFAEAQKLDPAIKLDPDLTNPEIQAAWAESKGEGGGEGAAAAAPEDEEAAEEPAAKGEEEEDEEEEDEEEAEEPKKAAATSSVTADVEVCPPDFPGCGDSSSDSTDEEEDKKPAAKNWVTVALQQDFLFFGSGTKVCSGGNEYGCFLGDEYYLTDDRRPSDATGNEISGGLVRATNRILLGYDRLFGDNLTAGARLGFAFGGGPQAPGGNAFVPLHFEVRGAYWIGKHPFARKGLRPYVAIGGGVSQVDGKLDVAVVEEGTGERVELEAWKKAGTSFAFAGGGAMYALSPKSGPLLELKYLQMFGSSSGGLAIALGYGIGF